MNILALDYGEKRIGIAKGSTETKIALPFLIIDNNGDDFVISKILDIVSKEDIELLIIGLPIGLSGKNTKQTEVINNFIKTIENKIEIPIITIDERLTTKNANSLFNDKKKRRVDDIAAMIMLQNYLDKNNSIY